MLQVRQLKAEDFCPLGQNRFFIIHVLSVD